jgi:hypothetical protein
MKRKLILIGIVLLVAGALATAWRLTRIPNRPELEPIAAKINVLLPRPYVDELVMEHAHVEGNRLVVDIRIPDVRMKQLDPKKIPLIHRQEQGDLNNAACDDADLAAAMKLKSEVARRFLDRDGKTIFEITAVPIVCKPPYLVQ